MRPHMFGGGVTVRREFTHTLPRQPPRGFGTSHVCVCVCVRWIDSIMVKRPVAEREAAWNSRPRPCDCSRAYFSPRVVKREASNSLNTEVGRIVNG